MSRAEWQAALDRVRVEEKALTRQADAVAAARRRLPMTPVDGDYVFDGPDGSVTLLDLFGTGGTRLPQLIVYHFMFGPDWDEGCEGCSWVVDAMTHPAHLRARDVNLVAVSRAPFDKLERYRRRMGWTGLRWYSSHGSSFNDDMGATVDGQEHHGLSVFLLHDGVAHRTYHTGDRGVEHLGSHWTYLDLTPFGRQELWENSPPGRPRSEPYSWLRRHDDYRPTS